jgi:hypothetical protein
LGETVIGRAIKADEDTIGKKPQRAANWIHSDAIGLTQHIWRASVAKVDAKLDSLSTPSIITARTVQTQAAENMASDANITLLDSKNVDDMTGNMTGNITSNTSCTTSGISNQSPLTMLEFSDIGSENEEREMVINKRKIIIVLSDDDEIDAEEEENAYADLDEEVLNVLLGLTDNMTLD